jgi:hypothetical protein
MYLWINLDESSDRRAAMRSHLERLGVEGDSERVRAFSPAEVESRVRGVMPGITWPEYGCLFSHVEALRLASFERAPLVVVLEDDARLPGALRLDALAESMPDGAELLLLGSHQEGTYTGAISPAHAADPRPETLWSRWSNYSCGSFAYAVAPAAARRFVETLGVDRERPVRDQMDRVFLRRFPFAHKADHLPMGAVRSYTALTPLASAGGDFTSTIHADHDGMHESAAGLIGRMLAPGTAHGRLARLFYSAPAPGPAPPAPKPAGDPAGPSVTVLQTCDGSSDYALMLEATGAVNRAYARRWGYQYARHDGVLRGYRPHHAMYNRIYLLRDLAARERRFGAPGRAHWLLYLDADAYVRDPSRSVESVLAELGAGDRLMVYARGADPRPGNLADLNDGVFLLNLSHPSALAFSEAWLALAEMAAPDSALRANDTWSIPVAPAPGSPPGSPVLQVEDQSLCSAIVAILGAFGRAGGLFLRLAGDRDKLMNYEGSWVVQEIRAHSDTPEDRLRKVREGAARASKPEPEAPGP